jgi:hypothetical protein
MIGDRTAPDLPKEHIANLEQIGYSAAYRPLRGPAAGAGVRDLFASGSVSVVGSQNRGHKEHGL